MRPKSRRMGLLYGLDALDHFFIVFDAIKELWQNLHLFVSVESVHPSHDSPSGPQGLARREIDVTRINSTQQR
jgi:hypothetical protein